MIKNRAIIYLSFTLAIIVSLIYLLLFNNNDISAITIRPKSTSIENLFLYILYIIIITGWSFSIFIRISDKKAQGKILTIALLLGLLSFLGILRTLLPLGIAGRYCWYLYYLPLLFIPTFLFWSGIDLCELFNNKLYTHLKKASFAFASILLLLVITNDYHQFVFSFYSGLENYEIYNYNFIYYIYFARTLYLIFAFIILTIRSHPVYVRGKFTPLIILSFISLAYFVGFVLRLPFFGLLKFSFIYTIIILSFVELSLRVGLIQNNTKYNDLFRFASVDMHILTNDFNIIYSTQNSLPPDYKFLKLESLDFEGHNPVQISPASLENIKYDIYKINFGYAIHTKNIDTILELQKKLRANNMVILQQNKVLQDVRSVKSEIVALQTKNVIYSKLENTLKSRVNKINEILDQITQKNNPVNSHILFNGIIHIKILINTCKRRGYITLQEIAGEKTDTSSLLLWFQEALEEARYSGIEGYAVEYGYAALNPSKAGFLYDCFSYALDNSLTFSETTILTALTVEKNNIKLSLVLEAPSIETQAEKFKLNPQLISTSNAYHTKYFVESETDKLFLRIELPIGGDEDE